MVRLIITALALVFVGPTAARAVERTRCDQVKRTVEAQIDAACPCAGAKSRVDYVRCVTNKLRELAACHAGPDGAPVCGPLPRTCVASLRRVALHSGCGESDTVSCCIPRQHDCSNDPAPGDGVKKGTCSGTNRPCDTLADCRIARCRQASSAQGCEQAGGTVGKGPDCRTACEP